MTNLLIPTNVTSVGQSAFSGCAGLINITIPDSVTSLADSAFSSCSQLTNVIIPPNITSLSDYLFFDCYNLASISIPNSVTRIGYFTFGDCHSLRGVSIPPNLTSLGGSAFYDCLSLTNIAIPDGVTSVGNEAFRYCESLSHVTLPKYLANIGAGAFFQCFDLGSITIPNTVTNIGEGAFWQCINLATVTLSTNLTSIAPDEFDECIALTNLTIPASVTNIGNDAFFECNGLTTLTIPSAVVSLGSQAFAFCRLLSSVYFLGNAPSADSSVLENDKNPTVYYLAGTSGWSNSFAGYPAVMLNAPNPFGSLQVMISPAEAVVSGASWQVDQGLPQPSRATVVGLSVGTHSIRYSAIGHWTAPSSQTVTVMPGQTTATNSTYIVDGQLGTYANALLSLHPVAYWQLNETNQVPAANVITNLGSLGLLENGFPFNDVVQGQLGVVNGCAAFSNPSLVVTYLGSHVSIPYNSVLNPAGLFTVEFWAKPNQITTDLFCPVSSVDSSQNAGNSRCGWLFYEGPGAQWMFRVGNINGYVAAIAGGTVQSNVWQHVAAVYDGTNVTLYVNGSSAGGPSPANGYSPNANPLAALSLGATSFGNRTFDGSVDEVAVYTNALSANTVAAHYQAALTNKSNYDAQVLASKPVGYWNLDEPVYIVPSANSLPSAFNLGSLSTLADGLFEPGSRLCEGGVPGVGLGITNLACGFQANGYIDVPGGSFQLLGPVTLIAWVKAPPGSGRTQSLVSFGTNTCSLTLDSLGCPHFSAGKQSFGDLIGATAINDNQWHQLAGIYDGTNVESLYIDGRLAAKSTSATILPLKTGEDLWIGGSPDPGMFQFFNGVIDEVAVFTNILTPNQLFWLFSAASNEAFLSPPLYSTSSGSVSLTWTAVPGLTYQLQATTNLSQNKWIILSTNVTVTNSAITISSPAGPGSQNFYRVLVLP